MFGLWENGFVFWDFYGGVVRHRIDGWMGTHDEVPKCQTNCKGMGFGGFLFSGHSCFDFGFVD